MPALQPMHPQEVVGVVKYNVTIGTSIAERAHRGSPRGVIWPGHRLRREDKVQEVCINLGIERLEIGIRRYYAFLEDHNALDDACNATGTL